VIEEGKCCIIVVNKLDLIEKPNFAEYESYLLKNLPFLKNYPIVLTSAISGFNVLETLNVAKSIFENSVYRVPQEQLDDFLKNRIFDKISSYPMDLARKNIKMFQNSIKPPTFYIKAKKKDILKKEMLRYIENKLRENFPFFGTPIRILLNDSS